MLLPYDQHLAQHEHSDGVGAAVVRGRLDERMRFMLKTLDAQMMTNDDTDDAYGDGGMYGVLPPLPTLCAAQAAPADGGSA